MLDFGTVSKADTQGFPFHRDTCIMATILNVY